MHLISPQALAIRRIVLEAAGPHARVRVFGSRLDDHARGGDTDLLFELTEPVANAVLLAARLRFLLRVAGKASRHLADTEPITKSFPHAS